MAKGDKLVESSDQSGQWVDGCPKDHVVEVDKMRGSNLMDAGHGDEEGETEGNHSMDMKEEEEEEGKDSMGVIEVEEEEEEGKDSMGVIEEEKVNEGKNLIFVKQEEKEEEGSHLMDGGYGWFVVFGSFLAFVIGGGFMKSGGLFFLQFQTRFQTSALMAAWPGSLMSMIQFLSSPLVSAVCNRYSVRTSVMIGSVLVFIGLILNSMVEDFYFLFFCHSLLQGLGLSFYITPGLFIVSSYFDKRRGLAVSMATSGGGVGTFLIIPLINFLFDFYGFNGCFFLLAAIFSHGFLVAMLFRPFSIHQTYSVLKQDRTKSLLAEEHCLNAPHYDSGKTSIAYGKDYNTAFLDDYQNPNQFHQTREFPNSHHTEDIAATTTTNTIIISEPYLKPPPSKSCFHRAKKWFKICFPSEHTTKGTGKNRKTFHFSLLKDVSFLLYLCSMVFFTIGMKAVYTFIPAICIEKGLTKTDAAVLLSIVGAVDTFGRMGCGFLFDLPKLQPFRFMFFTGCLFGIAVAGFCIPFLRSFAAFSIVCPLLGVWFGCHISQRAVVLVDLKGKDLLPSCMGLTKLFQALGTLVGPLLFGALRDMTGSFDIAFFVGSAVMVLSGLIMVLSNVVLHVRHRKQKEMGDLEE